MTRSLQGLFDMLLDVKPIFKNREYLRPSYIPEELPHRQEQIKQLARIMVAPLRGETPSNILIYGKTGTGKTATVKYVMKELEQISSQAPMKVEVIYINCEVVSTQYRVLATLANTLLELSASNGSGALELIPMTGWPTDEVYKYFFKILDSEERLVVIVLDEIDKLVLRSGDSVLYTLSRINSDLKNAKVSIVGISNDLNFMEYLDPRVKSSLSEEELVFPPYNAFHLRDILEQRAEQSFTDGVVGEGVITLCAANAAREHGDARRALDMLRVAGEIAEQEGAEVITVEHARRAFEKIERDTMVEVIKTLPTQSKLVLYSVVLLAERGIGKITTGEVYNVYRVLCNRAGVETLTQRRVSDLISELDMLGIVNATVTSKGRFGRTKEITLGLPVLQARAVLQEDYSIGSLEVLTLPRQLTLV